MLIQYGSIPLNLIDIQSFKREAVYIGQNYAYTRMALAIRAWLNPATQSDAFPGTGLVSINQNVPMVPAALPNTRFQPAGPPSTTPAVGPGVNIRAQIPVAGTISDTALRHQLMQPRQQLRLSVAGLYSLVSPTPGFSMDAMGGPKPIHCDVIQVGPRTWIIEWAVETCVNEAYYYKGTGQLPVVLAQTWNMTHTLDEDFFTTRTIEGQTLFRADALAAISREPDDYRSQMMIPAPAGFKRMHVEVKVGEQPNLIKWKVIDKQVPFGWSSSVITRLEAWHEIKTTKAPLAHVFGKFAKDVGGATGQMFEAGLNMASGNLAKGITGILKGGVEFTGAGLSAIWDAFPVSVHSVHVHAFGHPLSIRQNLEAFARAIVNQRLSFFLSGVATTIGGGAGVAMIPYGVETSIKHNLVGKEIILDTAFITGPIGTITSNGWLSSGAAGAVLNLSPMPIQDNTGNLLVDTRTGGVVPQPQYNGTRGNYLGSLETAAYQILANTNPPDFPVTQPINTFDGPTPPPIVV